MKPVNNHPRTKKYRTNCLTIIPMKKRKSIPNKSNGLNPRTSFEEAKVIMGDAIEDMDKKMKFRVPVFFY